ncbi:MAG: mechanosensitive ion channel [Cyanobacteria bacterium]|nr:mechanosensitive ion channel [Cyanobacteriota bacterium]
MRILVIITLIALSSVLAWPGLCQSHDEKSSGETASGSASEGSHKSPSGAASHDNTHHKGNGGHSEDNSGGTAANRLAENSEDDAGTAADEATAEQPATQAPPDEQNTEANTDETTADQQDADQQSDATSQTPTAVVKNYPAGKSAGKTNSSAAQPKPKPRRQRHIKTVDDYISDGKDWCETSGVQVLFALLLTALALKCTNSLSNRIVALITRNKEGTELKKRVDTLSSVVNYSLVVLICMLSGTVILKELGIDIAPILAGAGVVGIAVGFGAQSLVKDVISGFFMLLEDQVRVGDVVEIGDKTGVVDKVTLRLIVLRDVSYNVHYIPNGEVRVVTNMTKEYSGYVLDVGVSYNEDLDRIIGVMKSIDEEMRNDPEFGDMILEPLEIFGLEQFGDSKISIRARTKTRAIKQWIVGREFKRRLKARFNQLGIEMPNPIVSVYSMKGRDHPLGAEGITVETVEAAGASVNSP